MSSIFMRHVSRVPLSWGAIKRVGFPVCPPGIFRAAACLPLPRFSGGAREAACFPLPRLAGEGAPAGAGEGAEHSGEAAKQRTERSPRSLCDLGSVFSCRMACSFRLRITDYKGRAAAALSSVLCPLFMRRFAPIDTTPSPGPAGPPSLAEWGRGRQAASRDGRSRAQMSDRIRSRIRFVRKE
jgi:hypothetical protein